MRRGMSRHGGATKGGGGGAEKGSGAAVGDWHHSAAARIPRGGEHVPAHDQDADEEVMTALRAIQAQERRELAHLEHKRAVALGRVINHTCNHTCNHT